MSVSVSVERKEIYARAAVLDSAQFVIVRLTNSSVTDCNNLYNFTQRCDSHNKQH